MFIVKDGGILLIEKKRGLGAGKINGPGGKIDPGETPLQSVIRETQEELLITPLGARKLGELWFAMSDCPDILCHVFRADDHEGEPTETDEAVPVWTPLGDIPYSPDVGGRPPLAAVADRGNHLSRAFRFRWRSDALDGHAHRHRVVRKQQSRSLAEAAFGLEDDVGFRTA